MRKNILKIKNRKEFRKWLINHSTSEKECWIKVKRGKPDNSKELYYLDAVEEALCFGWIDSTYAIIDGETMQRFSPRRKNSNWSELNKERIRRLEKLGLLTEEGRRVIPSLEPRSFKIDKEIEASLKKERLWSKFKSFHPLYQRVKAGNISFYKKRNPKLFKKMLNHLIEETKKGKMFGEWNDYGRLLDY